MVSLGFAIGEGLIVLYIQGAKDAPAPRPNKRPRLGPSPDEASSSTAALVPARNVDSKSKGKAQLDDFMEVMRPKKGPSWANEAKVSQPSIPVPEAVVEDVVMEEPAKTEAMSDLEWMKQRTSANVDKVEKVFEQSDDEKEPEIETKEVRLLRLASFHF